MAEEKTVDQLSSEELFRQAMEPPAPEPEPAPAPEEPAPEPAPAPEPPAPVEATIPSWRLREEAEGRRQAEERARTLEERLRQVAAQLQQPKAPDFFENPDQAVQAQITRVLQPVVEEQHRAMMAMGKMVASAVHGQDKVDQAEQAFLKARNEGSLDPADYERVVGSPNRYDAAVQWHQRQNVLSSVGTDPEAWFQKQLEARMSDPKFQAAMMEKVRGGAAARPSQIKVPPSLSKATSVARNTEEVEGDMSDASLFDYAMRKGR